jgi:hypothetical protein
MSSATSTDAAKATSAAAVPPPAPAADSAQPWHFFVVASLAAATLAVIVSVRTAPEHLVMISVTVFAAGASALAAYHVIAPLVTERRRRRGVGAATRAALLAEKALALRTIKELEFDRAMGKVSQQDFDEMAGRLRARALSLMKQLDLGSAGYGAAIEEELRKRFQGARVPGFQGSQVQGSSACSCGTANDPDAVFCKKCGTRLAA